MQRYIKHLQWATNCPTKQLTMLSQTTMATLAVGGASGRILPQVGCRTGRFFESELVLGASGSKETLRTFNWPQIVQQSSSPCCPKQPWPLLQRGDALVESCHNLVVGHEGFLRGSQFWRHLGCKTMLNTFSGPQIIQQSSSLCCPKQPWPLLQWGEHGVESCHNLVVPHEGFLRVSWS